MVACKLGSQTRVHALAGGAVEGGESIAEPVTPSAFLHEARQLLQQALSYQDELRLIIDKQCAPDLQHPLPPALPSMCSAVFSSGLQHRPCFHVMPAGRLSAFAAIIPPSHFALGVPNRAAISGPTLNLSLLGRALQVRSRRSSRVLRALSDSCSLWCIQLGMDDIIMTFPVTC